MSQLLHLRDGGELATASPVGQNFEHLPSTICRRTWATVQCTDAVWVPYGAAPMLVLFVPSKLVQLGGGMVLAA